MNKGDSNKTVTTLSVLLILLVFSVAIIPSILVGAKFYRSLGETGAEIFEDRTAVQYMTTKLRQADGKISVDNFGGTAAIVITENIEGVAYSTRIYCYNGWLMELFALASGEFEPIDGEKLMPLEDMRAEFSDGLFDITFEYENGRERQIFLSPRDTGGYSHEE